MKKIPTIFIRNPDKRSEVLNEINPVCEWVFTEEFIVVTRKIDGTCVLIKDGEMFKRREIKKGKPTPDDFVLADYDKTTGKTVGWMPAVDSKQDRWHMEAFSLAYFTDGTYELIGPKIQGNPEGESEHILIKHSFCEEYLDCYPIGFNKIKDWLSDKDIEGLVFNHQDGRMAKIKKRDFGLERAPK